MADNLKFILDLDAKLGNIGTAASSLVSIEDALKGLDRPTQKTKRNLSALDAAFREAKKAAKGGAEAIANSFERIGGSVEKASKSLAKRFFGGIGSFFKDAASSFLGFASFTGAQALGRGAISFGDNLIRTAGAAEDLNRNLVRTFGAGNAERISDLASRLSKVSGIDDDVFAAGASDLGGVGFPLENIDKAFALVADLTAMTRGLRSRAEKGQRGQELFDAIERMQMKEGFDTRVLRSTGISEKDYLGRLTEVTGRKNTAGNRELVKQLLNAGELGGITPEQQFAALYEAVRGRTGKQPGAEAAAMGKTPLASLDRLLNAPDEIMKSMRGSPALQKLGDALGRIADMLDPDSTTGRKIHDGLEKMIDQFAKLLTEVDIKELSDTLLNLFRELPPMIHETTLALKALVDVMGWVGKGTEGKQATDSLLRVARGQAEPGNARDDASKKILDAAEKGDIFPSGVGGTVLGSEWLYNLMFGNGKAATQAGADSAAGFAAGMSGASPVLDDTYRQNFVELPKTAIDAHSPSLVYMELGRYAAEGFAMGLQDVGPDIGRALVPAPSAALSARAAPGERGRGGVAVTVPVTVNYTGKGGADAAREIAEMMKDIIPDQILAALEQIGLERGAA